MAAINAIDITSLTFQEGSAPSTPASTKWKIYTKTGGLYVIDDTGAEVLVGSPGTALLYDTTLSGTAASIDTSTVLGGYKHLLIKFQGRSDRSSQVFEGVNLQFNGDTGSNYDSVNSDFEGTADNVDVGESIGATSAQVGSITGNTGVANTAGQFEIMVNNYGATVFHKNFTSVGTVKYANSTHNVHTVLYSGTWRSTAAITRVVLLTRNSSNFIIGTRLTVYGMN